MKKPIGKTPRIVYDSSGYEFKVVGFTKDLGGSISGFRLKNLRGEKEIGLSEWKFYKHKKPKRK